MAVLTGSQRPRLESIPANIKTTVTAEDTIALAAIAGLHLDDWQKYCITMMLGQDEHSIWAAFEVLLIVSRQNGKGSVLEARELAGLFLFPSDRLMIHTAHEHKTASEHFRRVWSLIEHTPDLIKKIAASFKRLNGREFIETKASPTIILGAAGTQVRRQDSKRLLFIARSAGSGRGFTGDLLVYDEDMILDSGKVGASLPSLSARPNPQVIYAGSAGNKASTQLANVRRRGVAGNSSLSCSLLSGPLEICDDYCPADCTKHDDPDAEATVAKA